MNPFWQQEELIVFCKANIIITAYSPLGANGQSWGENRIVECNVLEEIGKVHGKTAAQVSSLRWLYDQGVTLVPKSYNTIRMKENLQIFYWSLTKEELNDISQLPQRKGFRISSMTETSDVVLEIDAERFELFNF